MSIKLTPGCIKQLHLQTFGQTFQPVVQILQASVANTTNGGQQRWKLSLSDGEHWMTAILGVQLNELVQTGKIAVGTVCRLTNFTVNVSGERKLILISQIESLGQHERIGSAVPTKVEVALGKESQSAQPYVQSQQPQQPQPQYYQNPVVPQTMAMQAKKTVNPPPVPMQSTSSDNGMFHPIKSLNPYQTRWTIKARVIHKSDMRTYNGAKGQGKFLNVDLVDSQGGEIRATMFNEAADKFYPILEANKAYIISKGNLKPATKKSGSQKHAYELYLDLNSIVQPCSDPVDIPKTSYHFVPIQNIENEVADASIDVLGLVYHKGDVVSFTTKAGKPLTKRTLTLLDETSFTVELTLWGAQAENPFQTDDPNPILALKNVKVSSFNNKSLNLNSSSTMEVNPDLHEAHQLLGWWERVKPTPTVYPVTRNPTGGNPGKEEVGGHTEKKAYPLKTFGQIKDEGLGRTKADFADSKGTISLIKHEGTLWYPACTGTVNGKQCNKKVFDQGPGQYKCERCGIVYSTREFRYILTLAAADHTGNIWLQCFNEIAQQILGRTADDLASLKETNNAMFEAVFQEATFKQYKFKIKAATETYQDESRVRYNIISATPLDFAQYSKHLIQQISSYY